MCLDIEFMLGLKTSFYWRMCWGIITPVMMMVVFFYSLVTTEQLLFGGTYEYPNGAYSTYYTYFIYNYSNNDVFIFAN